MQNGSRSFRWGETEHVYLADQPPSTARAWPVTKDDESEPNYSGNVIRYCHTRR
jgi:hypothetical protein